MLNRQKLKIVEKINNLKDTVYGHTKSHCIPVESCQIPALSAILAYYLEEKIGIFVEVGAFDGISFSNTYHLAAAGWRGIYCEPVNEYALKCANNHSGHPNVDILQVAISNVDDATLTIDTGGVFSTVDSAARDYFMKQGFSRHHFNGSKQLTVPTLTLSTLIHKFSLAQIDILVIDVEGHELSVLEGLSITSNRPSMIIIELQEVQHGKDSLSSSYARARLLLHHHKYVCVYSDLINSIFVEDALYRKQNNIG